MNEFHVIIFAILTFIAGTILLCMLLNVFLGTIFIHWAAKIFRINNRRWLKALFVSGLIHVSYAFIHVVFGFFFNEFYTIGILGWYFFSVLHVNVVYKCGYMRSVGLLLLTPVLEFIAIAAFILMVGLILTGARLIF